MCMSFRYSLLVYYSLVVLVLILTFASCYYVKFYNIDNPNYTLPFTQKRKNVAVFVPVYSESRESLYNTVKSVVESDYPKSSKMLIIVVDGIKQGLGNDDFTSEYAKQILNTTQNISIDSNYELYIGSYKGVEYLLLIKVINKGKKDSFLVLQKLLYYSHDYILDDTNSIHIDLRCRDVEFEKFKNIKQLVSNIEMNKIEYIMMLDTDTRVDNKAITCLADYLDVNIKTLAVCGETSISNKNNNILTSAQHFEYFVTHYTLKAFESNYGNVLVLSGCFTLYRTNILINKNLMDLYENEDSSNLYTANISKLGEDRFLTNLLLKFYPKFDAKYIKNAICYTDAPNDIKTLLCQKRRWTNSLIFCHLWLLLNTPKYSLFKRLRFIFIVVFELWIVLYMPMLLTIGYYYMILFIYNSITYNIIDIFGIIQTIILFIFPTIIALLLNHFDMIYYSVVFIFSIPLFSIIVPLYSIYFSDYIAWGNTRKTNKS
jgi:cellulose synthase/poly-beta-1,6-N-acetylglucosamine synthase-like glycosyltransferase